MSDLAAASSDAFELVAIASGSELLIYLDRFATMSRQGATIEVETPEGSVTAVAHLGEPYRLKAPWLATPGRFDLIFTITEGGTVDVLPLTLNTSGRRAGHWSQIPHQLLNSVWGRCWILPSWALG